MTKRQSTTAKVTKATADLIRRYILATGNGVMVRSRGVECGVTRVFDVDKHNRASSIGFRFHDSKFGGETAARAIRCTISKDTLAALKLWDERTAELYRLVLTDGANDTVGKPAGRYIVSHEGGLVFDDEPIECPNLSRFVDETLEAETAGVWRDCGKVYVDSNASFEGLEDALEFGRSSGQLAIFDAANGVCIDC